MLQIDHGRFDGSPILHEGLDSLRKRPTRDIRTRWTRFFLGTILDDLVADVREIKHLPMLPILGFHVAQILPATVASAHVQGNNGIRMLDRLKTMTRMPFLSPGFLPALFA